MHQALIAETSISAVISLLFFFTLFIGILVWLFVTGKSGRWARDARMPLDDTSPIEPRIVHSKDKNHG